MAQFKIIKKHVNSNILFNEISEFIEEGCGDIGVIWSSEAHRSSFVSLIDEWIGEKAEEGKVEQWNVVCDSRNNKNSAMKKGKYIMDVYYNQYNCLNMTHIRYMIDDSPIDDDDDWFTFELF